MEITRINRVMTGVFVLDACPRLDREVRCCREAASNPAANSSGSFEAHFVGASG